MITIVCDSLHTMEYLWKAAYCFHKAGSNGARQWVADHARLLLDGSDPSQVAAGMRRSATLRQIEERAAVDRCAGYIPYFSERAMRARLATTATSSAGSTGLGRCI